MSHNLLLILNQHLALLQLCKTRYLENLHLFKSENLSVILFRNQQNKIY